MTYEEFELAYFAELDNKPDFIRKGQCLFNFLYDIQSELANNIRGGDLDCFHSDRKIPATLKYIKEKWK